MSSPTPKSYASATQPRQSYGNAGRQSSWDSMHTLTEGMNKMNVRGSTPSKAHNRRSSSSSTSSTPIVTPIPTKDNDPSQSPYPQSGTPSQFQSPHVLSQSPHPSAYPYRSPPNGGGPGKDEVLQVNYELQPRHLLPSMGGQNNNKATNGSGPTFSPQGVNAYGQQAGVGVGGENKAAQDIAAQIALSTIQGLNAPQPVQPQGTGQSQMNGAPSQPPPLNQAALAAAAYNPALMQGLYGNGLYNPAAAAAAAAALGAQQAQNNANALNGGAQPFYPQQVQPDVAQAVANAMAQLPSGALHAALQGMGVGTYPLNPALNPALNPQLAALSAANPALMQQMQLGGLPGMIPGLPGMGSMGVQGLGMPGVGMGVQVPTSMGGQQQLQLSAPGTPGGGPSANNRKLSLYKTELCRSWEEKGTCRYGPKCQFAHGEEELKRVQRHPKYKTEICRTFWLSGSCPYGKRCCFIHTELPVGGGGEEKEGEGITPTTQPQASAQRSWEKDSAPSDSEQQQTSMLARIRRDPSASTQGNTPSPQTAHQGINGHGAIGSSISPAVSSPGMTGRPALGALRVDTKTLNETTVPKASYPFTSNPAMPAPGMSMQSEVVRGRLSPVPATAGPDFGRHAAARMEVVGISPHDQSQSVTPQASNPPGRLGSHMRSVSQTFPSGMSSAIEPSGGRISPIGGERAQHGRAESWGANTLIGPASAVEGRGRKW